MVGLEVEVPPIFEGIAANPKNFVPNPPANPLANHPEPLEPVKKTIKGLLLTGTMDNPAKDAVLNKAGFGAIKGCQCKEEGQLDFFFILYI